MAEQQYDNARHLARGMLNVGASTGTTIVGTAAADTVLFRYRCPRKMTFDEVTIVAMTGGTAAGPSVVVSKSLAGTGAAAGFATHAFGTDADNASAAVTTTSTDFAAGDHLLISTVAGTAASSPKALLMLGWKETFPAT
jgi:hypothetical protein